ncbi:MAG TPA: hypothetical protein VHB21_13080, partial [Minicystis sp.]|nr:hypothetical protein [Minicystis sp.]
GAAAWLAHAHEAAPPPGAELDPREVLNRVWFDKYPEKRRDEVNVLLFFSSGIGLRDSGSAFRSTFDLFEFERQRDKVAVVYFQDKKRIETSFKVVRCDDDPPFNVCLELAESPGGPKRYHGFYYEDEMDSAVPWARALRQSAEERVRAR